MGGARCSYRNCTMRSDGVTHMFHYPVFDKVRCHQWLTNAQRLDFLNLKVSQLRNRVVCQYHFKDDCFMNALKFKLKFEAVPTEDGPFCDLSQLPINDSMSEIARVTKDDIEHEYLTTTDKIANFSVKYGDFLTNCEVMDIDMKNYSMSLREKERKDERLKNDYINVIPEASYAKFMAENDEIMFEKKPKVGNIPIPSTKSNIGTKFYELTLSTGNQNRSTNNSGQVNTKSNKIKIISEKKLSKPIPVPATAAPVPSSIIIQPYIKKTNICDSNNDKIVYFINESNQLQEVASSHLWKDKINVKVEENLMNTNIIHVEKENITCENSQMHMNITHFEKENMTFEQKHMNTNSLHGEKENLTIGHNQISMNSTHFEKENMTIGQNQISMNTTHFEKEDMAFDQNYINPINIEKENMTFEQNHKTINTTHVEKGNISIVQNLMNTTHFEKDIISIGQNHMNTTHFEKDNMAFEQNHMNTTHFEKDNMMIEENHIKTNNINLTVPPEVMSQFSVTNNLKIPEQPKAIVHNIQTFIPQKPRMQSKQTNMNESSSNALTLKPKITPERISAIEKKRKFNMKLKEIVESCLEKKGENVKDTVNVSKKKHLRNEQHKNESPETSHKQEIIIHALEERLKNMEETLLSKINQNSERLNELKYSLTPTSRKRKSCGIQTVQNEESHKRQLYQEISKYLSPEVNSLIYEELFINKFVEKLPACSRKRRKKKSFINII